MDDSVIMCDEIIDTKANSYDKETKAIAKNFNKKKSSLENTRFLYFTCIFINYYSIIGSC